MKEAKASGKIKHPTAYRASVANDVEALRPEAEQALGFYDASPAEMAEYVEGRRSGRWLKKRGFAS